MTAAKLVTNPPQGSGLVPSLVDGHWEDLVRGRPGELVAVVALLQPVGTGQRRTKDGIHRTVTYEAVRLEPVLDQHEADQIAWQVTHAYEQRTSGSSQQPSLFTAGPAEQRERLVNDLHDWAQEEDVSLTDLDERWLSYFGGSEHAASATVQAGSLVQLMEFARYVGAHVDEPLAPNAHSEPGAGAESDVPAENDDDGDPEQQPAALAVVPEPGFQPESTEQ